jgi:CBS domain-containing protein
MSSPAWVVDESMPLPDVRQRLKQQHVRRLPVVNAAGQLVGIVTEGDVNRLSDSHITDVRDYNLYHRVADLPISEIMTRQVVTVTPDTSIMEVARLLLDHRIGGVPVVEHGQIIGMITESDLFRLIVVQQAEVVD